MQAATLGETPAGRSGEMGLRISLLGGFHAERVGEPVPVAAWQRSSVRGLLKLLVTEPAHRIHREQVLEYLWPDLSPHRDRL